MTSRLRVALVSEHASPLAALGGADAGGQNVYVNALARQLALLGCSVDVYSRRDAPGRPLTTPLCDGVDVHEVPAGPAAAVPKDELLPWMECFSDWLHERWRDDPPDVVHAHFWMSGWASLRAAGALGIPVVQTFHALGVVKRRHQGSADTSPVERAATERLLLRNAAAVIATCSDEVRELQALSTVRAPIEVVPCGVDDEFGVVGPVDPVPRRRRHRIVAVSRLVPRKGIGDTITALADVPDAELVVAGGPPADGLDGDPEVGRLRDLAEQLAVADRVDLRGSLGRRDVAALMRSADVVVCCPWYEPFGIVPVEAMACGVPVVGSSVGGLLDTICDGSTGLLVPPHRPELVAEAVRRLLASPAARRRMGAASARRAELLYRWPIVGARTLDVYLRLVAAPLNSAYLRGAPA
jgi:glycosyltransferase involved in cell wall biosynthesis